MLPICKSGKGQEGSCHSKLDEHSLRRPACKVSLGGANWGQTGGKYTNSCWFDSPSQTCGKWDKCVIIIRMCFYIKRKLQKVFHCCDNECALPPRKQAT